MRTEDSDSASLGSNPSSPASLFNDLAGGKGGNSGTEGGRQPAENRHSRPAVLDAAFLDKFARRGANAKRRIETNQTALVYFIRCACPTGFIKIGLAVDPGERLVNMQTSCPYRLSLLATLPGGMAAEREMHRRFAAACVGGEWFSPTVELLALIASLSPAVPPAMEAGR